MPASDAVSPSPEAPGGGRAAQPDEWTVDPAARGAAGRIGYQPRPAAPAHAVVEHPLTPAVATVLAPDERPRVDAAGQGLYHALHGDSVDAAARALRDGPVGAVLVSAVAVERGGGRWAGRVAELVRAHPAVPTVALVSGDVELATVFALGRCGVHAVVDVRRPDGWTQLRHALGAAARPEVAHLAAAVLAPHLAGASGDVRRFVATLFDAPPRLGTVRELSRALGVLPTTLMSRFFRAELPAPKRYLAFARLVRAADLLAHASWTVAAVADYMEYSSAQGFSRHLFLLLGVRPSEFRRRFTPRLMLDRFVDELLTPHQHVLRDFWPLRR